MEKLDLDVFLTRYSSDMQSPDSCDDQEREVRDGLARLGVGYNNPLVLKDEAESGTKCERDVFVQVMDLVRAGRVRLLAVDDQARFSRADYAFTLINDVVFHGGRFISTGEGIDTNQEGWELRVKVMELHNSTTIRELGRRVRRGQKGRVIDNNGSAGDYCFGYRSEFVDSNWAEALAARGPKPKKVVKIYEPEAAIVRWIFALFVALSSIGAIVRKLNDEKVPKGPRCRTPDWAHQHVRKILGNAKYVGRWAWGETVTVRDSRGRTRQVPARPDQSVLVERPDLRIIDDATWKPAQVLLRNLEEIYGKKPGQKSRAAKVHHTELYPPGLLNALIHCSDCGARLTIQLSGKYKYFGCPNHRKGTCGTVARVRVDRAEKLIVDLIGGVLKQFPDWMDLAIGAMRHAINETASRVPATLDADEKRLTRVEKSIGNLVNAIERGLEQSPAVGGRLKELEREAEDLRERIDEQRKLLNQPVEMPDDAWIRAQLADQALLLAEDTPKSALVLRKLLGKVTAHQIEIRGKKRGYIQLRFRIDAFQTLAAVLEDHVSVEVLNLIRSDLKQDTAQSPEFTIDLRKPSRMDHWAPKIAELRGQDVRWAEISRITGLSLGNAWAAWKRWTTMNDSDAA